MILKQAEEKLQELFAVVPPELLERVKIEVEQIEAHGLKEALMDMIDMKSWFDKKEQAYCLVGGACSLYVLKLLGIAHQNPLPSHYYCPKCKTIEYDGSVLIGYDLPDKKCSCGAELLKDGNNSSWEFAFLKKTPTLDMKISACDDEAWHEQAITLGFKQMRPESTWAWIRGGLYLEILPSGKDERQQRKMRELSTAEEIKAYIKSTLKEAEVNEDATISELIQACYIDSCKDCDWGLSDDERVQKLRHTEDVFEYLMELGLSMEEALEEVKALRNPKYTVTGKHQLPSSYLKYVEEVKGQIPRAHQMEYYVSGVWK